MVLHIYLRHAPIRRLGTKHRPAWFSYAACLENLLSTTRKAMLEDRACLNVVFDGTPDDLKDDELGSVIDGLLASAGERPRAPVLHHVNGGDQRTAWRACLKVVLNDIRMGRIEKDDYVYLLENDYLHLPGWFEKFSELCESGIRWDYLTFYDHLDKYPELTDLVDARRYRRLTSRLYCSGSHHWRTTPSTCATYVMSVATLLRDRWVLGLGIYDFKLFTLLTGVSGRVLLSPVPSLSTHCMHRFLAPAVDWEGLAR